MATSKTDTGAETPSRAGLVLTALLVAAVSATSTSARSRIGTGARSGMVLTIVGATLSATAPTIEVLIGARVFMGIAAGMAYPTTLSFITALWAEDPKRTSAIALWASVGGMASVAGSIVAGALLAITSTR